ncbi:MAG: Gfo/Idh/MocA family protein [Saccharofermentanales bacterium]
MLKAGLAGIGFMGRVHLDNYIRLVNEDFPVKITAICDIDGKKFKGEFTEGNIGIGSTNYDFSKYNLYESIDEMLENEELDFVDIALPTYLHAETTVKALNRKINVLCEKPMALNSVECVKMLDAAKKNGKILMVAQCLRFWPEYEYLKKCVVDGRYGNVTGAYFFRGGGSPKWSYEDWMGQEEKSGGCILDQHVHDVDMINWLFGKPEAVSTIAKNVKNGRGYDILSTNYRFDDGKVVNAQDDWTLNGNYGFEMLYRVNFEKANLIYDKGILRINQNDGMSFIPELSKDSGYYKEIKTYCNILAGQDTIDCNNPENTMQTIRIVEAEQKSADNNGCFVEVQ